MENRQRRWSLSELWWALPRIGKVGHGRAIGILTIWVIWDHFLDWRWKLQQVRPEGMMRYRLIRHRGTPVSLKDGTTIAKGDPIVELHLDNVWLARESSGADLNPWDALDQAEADFTALARLVADGKLGPLKAVYAVTLFSAPARREGFEMHPVPHNLKWSLRRYFLIGLIPIYHRDGWKQYDRMRRNRWPAELWMSINTLQQRHLKAPA